MKLSVALATFNEESNIEECLKSVKTIADEIVIVDGISSDKTEEIAEKYGAKVVQVINDPMFHNMKQKAFDLCRGEWILYLDADERVSNKLGQEIKKIIEMDNEEIEKYQATLKNKKLFSRHQRLLEKRDGNIGTDTGDYVAFFFPRLNYFLGKYMRYGGVYPDGVIRLFKKEKAFLPCKDVHEQLTVKGKVGWLQNDLLHISDPTFSRYLERNSRYINLMVEEFKASHLSKNFSHFIDYCLLKPILWFVKTQVRYKGILEGFPGIIFSFFSALRFPRAYLRYLFNK